jgi:hypothetical protein
MTSMHLWKIISNFPKYYSNSCYYAMYDYAKYMGETFAYVFLSLAIIFGLFTVFTCCLCFNPD